MGATLSTAYGYGFVMDPAFIEAKREDGSAFEWLEEQMREYPSLDFDFPTFYEYMDEEVYVVYYAASRVTNYGAGVMELTPDLAAEYHGKELLQTFARDIGHPVPHLGWYATVSVG